MSMKDIREEDYFSDKKEGWVKPDSSQGKLQTSLLLLADAFRKLADEDRKQQLQTVDNLKRAIEATRK
jgi:hypothetical protein